MGDLDAGYSTGASSSEEADLLDANDDLDENIVPPSVVSFDYNSFLDSLGITNDVIPNNYDTQESLQRMKSERIKRNTDFLVTISSEQPKTVAVNAVESTRDIAAIVIQRFYRGHLGRKIYLQKLKSHMEQEEELYYSRQRKQLEEGELLIETHKLEMEYATELLAIKYRKQIRQHNAIVIQRAWRNYKK